MSRDPDTLSPLEGILGYDIAQQIFTGPDNLVVEELSDYTYMTVMSEVLREKDREHLDPRWRVLPAGGVGTMAAVVALLGRQLDVTVVTNGSSNVSLRLNELADLDFLDAQRIVPLGPIAGIKTADFEDLFLPDDYVVIYNATFDAALTVEELTGDTECITDRIRGAVGDFNRSDPSNWFLRNRKTASFVLRPTTLDRFERLFQAINATLG